MHNAISCHLLSGKKQSTGRNIHSTISLWHKCQEKGLKKWLMRNVFSSMTTSYWPIQSSLLAFNLLTSQLFLLFIYSCVVNEYMETVQEVACKILELLAEGLGLRDSGVFSRLIRDGENDSLLRLNHYPPCHNKEDMRSDRIGFGEHSDPQIITLLRSNDVEGLQILSPSSLDGAVWVPVPPDPNAFHIMVGDLLQVMTNGRLVSVRHRAMVDSDSSRLSMACFGAPPLHERISPLPEMITPQMPRCYKSFTWAEYKKAMYSLRLGHNRLDLFRTDAMEEHPGLLK